MPKTTFLFFAAVLFAFSFSPAISAQQKWQFVTSKKVIYEKNPDEAIEKVLKKWNKIEPSDDLSYHFNRVDLNGDGKADAIVFVSGSSVCGSGGCRMLILKGDSKNYSLITEMSVSRPPLFVGATKTKGWNDLLMEVSSVGVAGIKTYFASLKFDGKTYPENPTVEPSLPKRSRAKFVEYLSGIETYDTGFELK